MSTGSDAAKIAIEVANDDSHGYDQGSRWGPDYDCSSLIISIYTLLGVPLTCTYTGNMLSDMLKHGFLDVTRQVNRATGKGMLPGDVLLHPDHAAMFIGNRKLVAARINEKGTVTGGQTGDQTGREICEQDYYNYPWTWVLRYDGEHLPTPVTGFPWVQYGSYGVHVYAVQAALIYRDYLKYPDDLDAICGLRTKTAIENFQQDHDLEVDGIAGDQTLGALFSEGVK